eukprot:158378-Pyramimonas_sp.AAC.1
MPGGKHDYHEGHQSASSMAPLTTYRDDQYALPHIRFEGEQWDTSTGYQGTYTTMHGTTIGQFNVEET